MIVAGNVPNNIPLLNILLAMLLPTRSHQNCLAALADEGINGLTLPILRLLLSKAQRSKDF